jgi:hypothetical protein
VGGGTEKIGQSAFQFLKKRVVAIHDALFFVFLG